MKNSPLLLGGEYFLQTKFNNIKQNKMRKATLENSFTSIRRNTSYEAKPLEDKLREVMTSKEPIDMSAGIIYTDRRDGARPEYDIRTDKWDIAMNKVGEVAKTRATKREEYLSSREISENGANPIEPSNN